MGLIDRLATDEQAIGEHIAGHMFSAALWFLSKGDITRAQLVSMLNLSADDVIQLDQIIAFFGTLSANEKGQWHNRVEAAVNLLEGNYITRTQFKQLLGIV